MAWQHCLAFPWNNPHIYCSLNSRAVHDALVGESFMVRFVQRGIKEVQRIAGHTRQQRFEWISTRVVMFHAREKHTVEMETQKTGQSTNVMLLDHL